MAHQPNSLWLRFLGGKKERTGFGIAAIGLIIGLLGVLAAFIPPEPRDDHVLFWVGYVLVIIGILVGIVGTICHFVTMAEAPNE